MAVVIAGTPPSGYLNAENTLGAGYPVKRVLLDGKVCDPVLSCHTEEGWVEVLVADIQGRFVVDHDTNSFMTERLYGQVTVEWYDPDDTIDTNSGMSSSFAELGKMAKAQQACDLVKAKVKALNQAIAAASELDVEVKISVNVIEASNAEGFLLLLPGVSAACYLRIGGRSTFRRK